MTRKQALIELRDKVKAGTLVPDNLIVDEETSKQIELAVNISPLHGDTWSDLLNAYDGYLDAAKALHEAVLPGWGAAMEAHGWAIVRHPTKRFLDCQATSDNPARAWLLAILEALIAQEPDT